MSEKEEDVVWKMSEDERYKGAREVWVREMESFSCSGLWNERGCVKKKENGQIFPSYKTARENSLTIRLELYAINGHDCPMTSTAKIKGPFKISNQRWRYGEPKHHTPQERNTLSRAPIAL